jgi:two-component system, sensor histidine kinase and response regulator
MIDTMTSAIDLPALMDRLAGDRDLLKELIGLYLEDEQALLDEVAAAIASGDPARLARSAHTLKGSVGNFCSAAAHRAAAALEAAGRANQMDAAGTLFSRLVAELDAVREDMRVLLEDKGV